VNRKKLAGIAALIGTVGILTELDLEHRWYAPQFSKDVVGFNAQRNGQLWSNPQQHGQKYPVRYAAETFCNDEWEDCVTDYDLRITYPTGDILQCTADRRETTKQNGVYRRNTAVRIKFANQDAYVPAENVLQAECERFRPVASQMVSDIRLQKDEAYRQFWERYGLVHNINRLFYHQQQTAQMKEQERTTTFKERNLR